MNNPLTAPAPKTISQKPVAAVDAPPVKKSLTSLAKQFCADADNDPIAYLLRSNTFTDGE